MRALVTAILYFGSFIAIGVAAKLLVARFMEHKGADLSDVHAQAGPNRRRSVFLLGSWRREG
jgi:hypothetical protein